MSGREWLSFAHEAKRLAATGEFWWRRFDRTPLPLELWAQALVRVTPGERYCPICRAMTHAEAEWRCRLPASCPAEDIWPEHAHEAGEDPCGYVICRCECTWCGGDRWQEGDEPGWDDGEMARCKACGGSGLLRKQTVF